MTLTAILQGSLVVQNTAILATHHIMSGSGIDRKRARVRKPMWPNWSSRVASLTPNEFVRRYRMPPHNFADVHSRVRAHVATSHRKHSSEFCLLAVLRFVSGGAALDICEMHGMSEPFFYSMLPDYCDAIYAALCETSDSLLNSIDHNNEVQLDLWARGYEEKTNGAMQGCVGAVDGLCVHICKPRLSDSNAPAIFFNRKGFYSLNLQAICNANYEIIWFDFNAVGSTHDATALAMTHLQQKLDDEALPGQYFIAGDDAYSANAEQIVTPFPGSQLPADKDNFNFYLSNSRISIEQTFGILVARFGVLWRRLDTRLALTTKILKACIALHNYCLKHKCLIGRVAGGAGGPGGDRDLPGSMRPIFQSDIDGHAGQPFRPGAGRGRRRQHARRQHLADAIAEAGLVRPHA